ncbi:MAG: hypothetical protein HC944_04645, partial [Nanoarchaeota archaeon]|nr:hypothetical protein [Nanoarchaeota archaeon]
TGCIPDCSATYVSGPTPSFYPRLKPGETAAFTWTYTIEGVNTNQIHFTTSLENGISGNNVTTTVEVRDILSALESGTALTSLGLQSNGIDASILMFHDETDRTPSGEYQMFSASPDGGSNGLKIDLDATSPSFLTQTTSNTVNVPAGDWVSSLRLQSEPMPSSLLSEGEDMIFHFSTNNSIQDNSEGTSDADLEGCGVYTWSARIATGDDDGEERVSNGNVDVNSSDLEMPYDGGNEQIIGLYYPNISIPQGATIQSAEIEFESDENQGGTTHLRIRAEDSNNAATIDHNDNYNISDRPDTSEYILWQNIPSWSTMIRL